MHKYAIVTLVDLTQRADQLIDRLFKLADALVDTEFILSIGHGDRSSLADIKLKKKLAHFKHVQFSSVKPEGNEIELARMRNVAVRNIDSSIVLLVDVDIYPDLKLFRHLVTSVEKGERIAMAPCIYLTAYGNRLVEKGNANVVVESALAFSPDYVMHWALPSSVIALRVDDYRAIAGFQEVYRDHGYEDFDFMLRLAVHIGLIKPSVDLLIDRTYRAPLLSVGFRATLGRFCLENLLNRNIAFHLYHKKNQQFPFYKTRKDNSIIFQKKIKILLGEKSNEESRYNTHELVCDFFAECARLSVDPSKYFALFDARPRYHLRPSSTWKRFKNIFDL